VIGSNIELTNDNLFIFTFYNIEI